MISIFHWYLYSISQWNPEESSIVSSWTSLRISFYVFSLNSVIMLNFSLSFTGYLWLRIQWKGYCYWKIQQNIPIRYSSWKKRVKEEEEEYEVIVSVNPPPRRVERRPLETSSSQMLFPRLSIAASSKPSLPSPRLQKEGKKKIYPQLLWICQNPQCSCEFMSVRGRKKKKPTLNYRLIWRYSERKRKERNFFFLEPPLMAVMEIISRKEGTASYGGNSGRDKKKKIRQIFFPRYRFIRHFFPK